MRAFTRGQRVTIETFGNASLVGQSGTVRRVRMGDNGAWVEMDSRPPAQFCSFPADDSRANHLLLCPELCNLEGAK